MKDNRCPIPHIDDPRGNLAFIQPPLAGLGPALDVAWVTPQSPAAHALRVEIQPASGIPGEQVLEPAGDRLTTHGTALTVTSAPLTHPAAQYGADPHIISDISSTALDAIDPAHPRLPFDILRAFYLYDVPLGAGRGGHSHHAGRQVLIAVTGSFDVTLDDGVHRRTFTLDNPTRALHIAPGVWRTMQNFSHNAVCLALTDTLYSEDDYVRDYTAFLELTRPKRRQ